MRFAIALLVLIAAIVIFDTSVLIVLFILAIGILIFAASIRLVSYYWDPHDEHIHPWRQLFLWAGKGILVPLVFWILVNTGISTRLPPLITHPDTASHAY